MRNPVSENGSMVWVSIITPSLNRRSMLREAIESVLSQRVDDIQHIIVDAQSSDGTSELLAEYNHLEVICEPDKGIYDGINKGLARARGEFIVLLNSDDILLPNALDLWLNAFKSAPDADIISGSAQLVDYASGALLQRYDDAGNRELGACEALLGLPIINARMFRRSVFDRIGGFDLAFRTLADRDWLVRAWLEGARNVPLCEDTYCYRGHLGSATYAQEMSPAKRLSYAQEAATLARHVQGLSTDRELMRAARILSDKSSASEFMLLLRSMQYEALGAVIVRALSLNPLWPLSVAAILLARASGVKP